MAKTFAMIFQSRRHAEIWLGEMESFFLMLGAKIRRYELTITFPNSSRLVLATDVQHLRGMVLCGAYRHCYLDDEERDILRLLIRDSPVAAEAVEEGE